MDKRIAVSPAELARAIRVWLKVMPRHVWRALERYQIAALDKRHDPEEEPAVHAAVADHIVGQLERARWAVSRPEPPTDLGSPPPWSGRPGNRP
jgi:hypothetical protein